MALGSLTGVGYSQPKHFTMMFFKKIQLNSQSEGWRTYKIPKVRQWPALKYYKCQLNYSENPLWKIGSGKSHLLYLSFLLVLYFPLVSTLTESSFQHVNEFCLLKELHFYLFPHIKSLAPSLLPTNMNMELLLHFFLKFFICLRYRKYLKLPEDRHLRRQFYNRESNVTS